ncbi:UNVERIFIED_CONTAM: hypothetical protein HDU68_008501 [Siphonaria sp. JEL0065]|nr:hypothetical protein HDU68_008501 [Siphonaria sp. JEL0065]
MEIDREASPPSENAPPANPQVPLATIVAPHNETIEAAKIFGAFCAWVVMRLVGRRFSLLMQQKGHSQNLPDSYIRYHLTHVTKMSTLLLLRAPTPPQTLLLALHLLRNLVSVPQPLPTRLSTPTRILLGCLMIADSMIGAERGIPMRIWNGIAKVGGLVDGVEDIERQQPTTATSTPTITRTPTPVDESPRQQSSIPVSPRSPTHRRPSNQPADVGLVYLALLKQDALAVLDHNIHPLFLSYSSFLTTIKELVTPNTTTEQGQGIVAGVPPASAEMKEKMMVILEELSKDQESTEFSGHVFKEMGKLDMKWRW